MLCLHCLSSTTAQNRGSPPHLVFVCLSFLLQVMSRCLQIWHFLLLFLGKERGWEAEIWIEAVNFEHTSETPEFYFTLSLVVYTVTENVLSATPCTKDRSSWNDCQFLQIWIMHLSCKQAAFSNRNSSAQSFGLWDLRAVGVNMRDVETKYPGIWDKIRKWEEDKSSISFFCLWIAELHEIKFR